MVARTDSSMFGCYGDSYSYRLWSLANVWSTCQFRPLAAGVSNDAKAVDSEDEPRGTSPLGPGGPFTCAQCGGAYPTQEQLDKHETLHAPNTQVSSNHSCKICQKSFANVYRLQRHMISHDESALLRKFKCNDCDKAFKFKHHLKEHLRIHSGEKPFVCGNCGKKFSHSGSYSSHMTSKKCLVMNLKMGRIKPNNPALNPDRSPSRKRPSAAMVASQINNNLSPNGNAFMPISKYNEAAAAAFLASMSPQDGNFHPQALAPHGVQPFYIPPGMPLSPANGIAPYSLPALSQFFQIASTQYQQRKFESQMGARHNIASPDPEDMIEEVTEDDDKRSSVSSDQQLIMDVDDDEAVSIKKEREDNVEIRDPTPAYLSTPPLRKYSPEPENHIGIILDSVNASATKHILQGHMQKLSPVSGTVCPSVESPPAEQVAVKPDPEQTLGCSKCNATFNHKTELIQHEKVLCGNIFRKHEGLAAQVAETLALNRIESEMRTFQSGVSASEDEDCIKEERDDKMSLQESDRKIRVRTAISEEQQAILKEHYKVNQRPNREEFKRIAHQLGLDNRVVQVWFQNNRARVRRMNQNIAFSEQPLDLSTKKSSISIASSPSPSPPCSMSVTHSDSGEEAVNLSQKSSRSTTPYRSSYPSVYPHSNCSSSSFADFRHSPSPGEPINGHRRMIQPKVPLNGLPTMLPVDKLLHYDVGASRSPLPFSYIHHSQDMNRHNPSPGYEKRPWNDDPSFPKDVDLDERLSFKKKRAKQGGEMKEVEGQYVCDLCDKTFIKQSSLLRHKYEHSGQRPYKCMECDKAFKHKHHLTEHKRLHTGEKPFQCCKCLKKFSHSGSYSQHMNHRYSYCKPYRE